MHESSVRSTWQPPGSKDQHATGDNMAAFNKDDKMAAFSTDDKIATFSSTDSRADSGLGSLDFDEPTERQTDGTDSDEFQNLRDFSRIMKSRNVKNISATNMGSRSGETLPMMDLDEAISGMKIDESASSIERDTDSGVFVSFASQQSKEDDFEDRSTKNGCERHHLSPVSENRADSDEGSNKLMDMDCNFVSDEFMPIPHLQSFMNINSDGDNQLNLDIIHERRKDALRLIDFAMEPDWLNMQNTLYQTPLHLAVVTQQPEVVRRLICTGANVLHQNHAGNTPLHCACALGNDRIVKHFLTPVRYDETRANRYKIQFQRLPQDSHIRNSDGDTCLHVAVKSGHLSTVRLLLNAGADPNIGDGKAGRTALHHAAESGQKDLVRLIMSKRKVDLNALDYANRTPARLAVGRGQMGVVELLERHGGVVSGSDVSDNDIVDDAMESRHDAAG